MINDDKGGTLGNVYNQDCPLFDPGKICFRMLRNTDHRSYNDRKTLAQNVSVVWEDWEPYKPGEGDIWHALEEQGGAYPIRNNDFVITACITTRDHLWPVPYVYNNYHFVQTHHANLDMKIAYPTERKFFADVLLGNSKPHRLMFFELMKENNMLDKNIINLLEYIKMYLTNLTVMS